MSMCNTASLWVLEVQAAVNPECSSFGLAFSTQDLSLCMHILCVPFLPQNGAAVVAVLLS